MNQIKINSIVVKDDISGVVINIINNIAYIWWNKPGRYRIEPHSISTLRLLEDEEVRI